MNFLDWQDLMRRLSIGPNRDVFDELVAAYAERHRHYHTAAHIDACLRLLAEHHYLATDIDAIECALWFHDAVYNPFAKDNEQKSAEWAARFLHENHCPDAFCDKVRQLILATIHAAPAEDPDTCLLVDIDLGILGTDAATYQLFEANVRREYKWVPGPLFRRERRKILQSFLDRPSIYSTAPFLERYEAQARRNIQTALEAL